MGLYKSLIYPSFMLTIDGSETKVKALLKEMIY
ncbi:hypothetical protein LGKMAHEF_01378 [Aeromonas salmonicida]|uniref:Uncharacterized protein n=1 Tax=Aeromonas salmonicida subsp. salmonicida 01-B526 TaxID=1076135 RepID=A0ABN0E210_AERSS|nr:hypothetical protein IYQ_07256 [Aeromonas salmonicida subsp. salmonicida 01-B526]SPT73369.1 Uncharacterised protein [Aeromonas salmonicida]SUU70672.1 Uncharacterised protein [Aeromonas salmonicida]